MTQTAVPTFNFLVPQDGTTHDVISQFVASATPYTINWAGVQSVNNMPFRPQGFRIDASQTTAPTLITIRPIGSVISVPKGFVGWFAFPAPEGQTVSITGAGPVVVDWVNYPIVAVDSTGLASYMTGQGSVAPVVLAQNTIQANNAQGAASAAAGPLLTHLVRVQFSISANATLAAAGLALVTIKDGLGNTIFAENVYIPSASTNSLVYERDIVFDASSALDANNTLTLTSVPALNAGQYNLNVFTRA